MTIYEIKEKTAETEPYFFSRKTLKFFGQTMRSFRVTEQSDGMYLVTAPIKIGGRIMGETERYYNPSNNKLEQKQKG